MHTHLHSVEMSIWCEYKTNWTDLITLQCRCFVLRTGSDTSVCLSVALKVKTHQDHNVPVNHPRLFVVKPTFAENTRTECPQLSASNWTNHRQAFSYEPLFWCHECQECFLKCVLLSVFMFCQRMKRLLHYDLFSGKDFLQTSILTRPRIQTKEFYLCKIQFFFYQSCNFMIWVLCK